MIGQQKTPDAVGTEVGVRADLRRGVPNPREMSSQDKQLAHGEAPGPNKNVKWQMREKVRSDK